MLEFQLPAEDSRTLNRDRLLTALAGLGVRQVVVAYEGGGDSGDVSEVSVEPPELLPTLRTEMIELRCRIGEFQDGRYQYRMADQSMSLHRAVSDFTLDWVGDTHGGWENNEGGNGSVTIDVEAGTLRLEHTEYFTESQDYVHEL